MKLFKRGDPATQLKKDRAALAAGRANLVELERQRQDMLLESEGYEPIAALDRRIVEQRHALGILTDRIAKLALECRKAEQAKLEQAKLAAIEADTVPAFAGIQKHAARLEAAVWQLAESYSALDQATKELNASWPAAVRKPAYWSGGFSLLDIKGRITTAMRYGMSGSIERFAEFARIDRDESIVEMTRRQLSEAITELRAVEVPLPPIEAADDDDDTPSAAAPVAPHETRRTMLLINIIESNPVAS
jgi:hypothetical protein